MSKLSMAIGRETIAVYKIVLLFQGEYNNEYSKYYKRYGDAFKRCNELNKTASDKNYHWKLMCAKGWYDIDPNDKGE
ncbi:hypothetical protein [Lactiplantibacillus plantarum]|uniref:hypothetical protein n=1 Tax=Lactiplantibacillus plantarum TaxID=1590 RepID=UPI00295A9667|nr:hypothetical protein [Lactiplantibacillus plantarum]MDV9115419.1 hypothetical protein [Lactiplantibacillus plantarum]